jgi:hypothetical protein
VRANSTQWGGDSGFDPNRAFAGIGWNFTPQVCAELGCLNQNLADATHQKFTLHHRIMGSVFINF